MNTKIGPELLIAGIGLFLLSVSATQTPKEVAVDSINTSDIGEKVTVHGNTSNIYSTEEASFMDFKDESGDIGLVAFESLPLHEGESVVTGRVDLYQGDLQLIVEDVTPEFERPVRDSES